MNATVGGGELPTQVLNVNLNPKLSETAFVMPSRFARQKENAVSGTGRGIQGR